MTRLALTLSLAMVVAAPALAQPNLLNNPGFEEPLAFDFADPSIWNGFFGGPAGTFLEAFNDTGATPNSGAQALELTLDGADGVTNGFEAFVGQAQTVPGISGGDEVALSIFARNNDSLLTGNVEFRIEFLDSTGAQISNVQLNLEDLLTDDFQEFSINTIAPGGTVSANTVLALASFNEDVFHSNSVVFDDASLVIIPEPAAIASLAVFGSMIGLRRRRN